MIVKENVEEIAEALLKVAFGLGSKLCGLIVIHRKRTMRLRWSATHDRWFAETTLDDMGDDVMQVVEEGGASPQAALDACADAADEAERLDESEAEATEGTD